MNALKTNTHKGTAPFLLSALFLAGIISARAQALEPVADDSAVGIGAFGMDPVTFEIKMADGFDPLVWLDPDLNSPEQIEIRKTAYLALHDPEEYWRQNPKSAEQLAEEAAAAFAVIHPMTLEQKFAVQTEEENAADQKAIFELSNVNPEGSADVEKKGPGPMPATPSAASQE